MEIYLEFELIFAVFGDIVCCINASNNKITLNIYISVYTKY